MATRPSPAVHSVAMTLVLVNAFNRSPVSPARRRPLLPPAAVLGRHLRAGDPVSRRSAAIALIASVAIGFWILAIMGVFMLFGLPRMAACGGQPRPLQQQSAISPGNPSQIPEARLRAAFLRSSHGSGPGQARSTPARRERDRAGPRAGRTRPPSILASVLLFVPWLAARCGVVRGVVLLASHRPRMETVQVPEGRFSC